MRYRWFANDHEKDDLGQPVSRAYWGDEAEEKKERRIFSWGERTSAVLAAAVICYSLWSGDVQMTLFALAVLIYLLHPLARKLGGSRGDFIGNLLKGFSLALGWGTILWVFL
jgi:cobalamin synthase